MTTDELLQLFTGEKAYRQLAAEIRPGRSVGLASLAGSSLSLVAAAAVRQTGGLHVFVMEDRDAAGYLYNDLFPLLGEERLLFFPTGYKRSIQFGQEDPSGIVQRTAALNAVKNNDGGALALGSHTLHFVLAPRSAPIRKRWPKKSSASSSSAKAS